MPASTRPRRPCHRLLAVFVVLATSVLPGCLTQALWQDELWRPGVPQLEVDVVAERTVVHDGRLEVLRPRPGAAPQLRVHDGVDDGAAQLRPDPRNGQAAGAAAIEWLLACEHCDVTGSRLLVERWHLLGEGLADQAELELELRPRLERLAQVVGATAVPPAVLELLNAAAGPRFAFAADGADEVGLAAQCRQRLAALDLAALLGSPWPVTVERLVFCDEEGRVTEPRRPPVTTGFRTGAGEWITELGEQERLERDLAVLTGQTMWVAVRGQAQRHYLRVAAGELWLVFAGERRGDRVVHHSRWCAAQPKPAERGELLAVLPTTLVRHELSAWRSEEGGWTRVPSDGLPVWKKVLLTPFTLVIDLLSQHAWRLLVPWQQYDSDQGVGRGR